MFSKLTQILHNPLVIFIACASVFGISFVFLNPPLWGLDEGAHFARAYQLTNGQLIPDSSKDNFGGKMPDNFVALSAYRNADILDHNEGSDTYSVLRRKDVTDVRGYDTLLSEHFSVKKVGYEGTATYFPTTYPGPVVAIGVGRAVDATFGQMLFAARLLSLVSYTAISAAAIWIIRKKKIVWLFVLVAALPTSLFQAATVSSDTIIFSLSLLFFAIYLRLLTIRNDNYTKKVLLSLLSISALLLVLTKINFIFILLLVAVLPSSLFASRQAQVLYKFITVIAAVLSTFIWTRLQGVVSAPLISQRKDGMAVNPSEQISYAIHNPVDFLVALGKTIIIYGDKLLNEVFFTFSGTDIRLPTIFTIGILFALIAVAFYAKDELVPIKKHIVYINVATLVASISIAGALYAVFNPVGWWYIEGIQGRYFTPFLLPFIALIVVAAPSHLKLSLSSTKRIAVISLITVLAVSYIYGLLAFY